MATIQTKPQNSAKNMETSVSTVPEQSISLWYKCTGCAEFVFRGELERNLYICSYCRAAFPLLAEKRIEYLLDDPSTAKITSTNARGLTAEGTISGYLACLFIIDIDVVPQQIDVRLLLTSIESALHKQVPLITIVACPPEESREPLADITYLTLQLDRLAEASLPHITVITESVGPVLTACLPIGDLVIMERRASAQKSDAQTPQPASHAPEEQLLTQPPTTETETMPDIGVDRYVSREELPELLGRFLKFFRGNW